MPKIFISYRRGDSAAITGHIADRLAAEFGRDQVFRDIDSIPLGTNFRKHIQAVIGLSNVMITVVGRRWTDRLHDPDDVIRTELETALNRRMRVIPVLVDGARMPRREELPESLRDFATINALRVGDGPDFEHSMRELRRAVEGKVISQSFDLGPSYESSPQTRREPSVSRPRPAVEPGPRKPEYTKEQIEEDRRRFEEDQNDIEVGSGRAPLDDTGPGDGVEFGVSYPPLLKADATFIVDAWLFLRADRLNALDRAKELKPDAAFRSGGATSITRGTKVRVRLKIGSCKIEPAWQELIWDGAVTNVSFAVTPTEPLPELPVGMCTFFVGGLRIGHVSFNSWPAQSGQEVRQARGIRTAFASYASKDRPRVLARVQGMEKLPIKVFVDVHNLRSNDEYPIELFKQIAQSDVLYLFWSKHASRSEWVTKEWKHGLAIGGPQFIDPVPLVSPRKVPPPEELAKTKHFDDWTLAYLAYERSQSRWDRLRAFFRGE